MRGWLWLSLVLSGCGGALHHYAPPMNAVVDGSALETGSISVGPATTRHAVETQGQVQLPLGDRLGLEMGTQLGASRGIDGYGEPVFGGSMGVHASTRWRRVSLGGAVGGTGGYRRGVVTGAYARGGVALAEGVARPFADLGMEGSAGQLGQFNTTALYTKVLGGVEMGKGGVRFRAYSGVLAWSSRDLYQRFEGNRSFGDRGAQWVNGIRFRFMLERASLSSAF